jgi:hypothetical protein
MSIIDGKACQPTDFYIDARPISQLTRVDAAKIKLELSFYPLLGGGMLGSTRIGPEPATGLSVMTGGAYDAASCVSVMAAGVGAASSGCSRSAGQRSAAGYDSIPQGPAGTQNAQGRAHLVVAVRPRPLRPERGEEQREQDEGVRDPEKDDQREQLEKDDACSWTRSAVIARRAGREGAEAVHRSRTAPTPAAACRACDHAPYQRRT